MNNKLKSVLAVLAVAGLTTGSYKTGLTRGVSVGTTSGRISGCNSVAKGVVNPVLEPECVVGKGGLLAVRVINPRNGQKAFFNPETGELLNDFQE